MTEAPFRENPGFEALLARARAALPVRARWAAAAPGRVNLIGDHTDYVQGFVLPFAIDRHVVTVAAPAPAGEPSTLRSDAFPDVLEADLTAPLRPRRGHWANPVLGVVHETAAAGHAMPNMTVAIAGDVPVGAGLSSSAALEVATATLLETALGFTTPPLEMAERCRRAEHEFVGTPCGVMDMLVSIAARPGCALLIDCRSLEIRPVRMPDDLAVLVIDSGVRRALATTAYADRRATCERTAAKLGLSSLRDASIDAPDHAALDDVERRRVAHVVGENARTRAAAAALEDGRLDEVGRLVNESHASLRDLYEVSCPELDAIVTAALAQDGVLGARMTGAGFGGCAIALCRGQTAERAARVLGGFVVRAVSGARAIPLTPNP